MNGRRWVGRIFQGFALVSLVIFTPALADDSGQRSLGDEQFYALAPQLAQIVNLAILDPVFAATLVPDPWIDSLAESALAVEAEVPAKSGKSDPPQSWPIGAWRTPAALVASIESVEPRAVAALYRALRPRFAMNCRRRGTTFEKCERAVQVSMSRLSAPVVQARAAGGTATSLTPTQRELARLGEPVVLAVRHRLDGVGKALWSRSSK
jgi:hypothetical protein